MLFRVPARLFLVAVLASSARGTDAVASTAAEAGAVEARTDSRTPRTAEAEFNVWPFRVTQLDGAGQSLTTNLLGPIYTDYPADIAHSLQVVRPVWYDEMMPEGRNTYFLFPFFSWQERPGYRRFSFFELINYRRQTESDNSENRGFDVWPFYFSRDTGDPETSYHALFPIAGTMKYRLGKDRLSWVLFPLYGQTAKGDMRTTYAPWPFIRVVGGDGHHGFGIWPLFERREREGDYRNQFYLWPLFYKNESNLSDPVPEVKFGALPFYARESGPGHFSETYAWPFFGHSERTQPSEYRETRYFWPFFVQGRGTNKYVNRWGPFYTHSNVKGYDKQWFLWPLVRHADWQDGDVEQTKDQFLYFVWWSLEQRSLANPAAAPATKRHLWPLFSSWNNGAGRRQLQVLSPFEVFLPNNEPTRRLYTPLFALFRLDERGDDTKRWSLLWDAVTWRRKPGSTEFHLGPLLGVRRGGGAGRVAFGAGLFGFQRGDSGAWRPFLFDFNRKRDTNNPGDSP